MDRILGTSDILQTGTVYTFSFQYNPGSPPNQPSISDVYAALNSWLSSMGTINPSWSSLSDGTPILNITFSYTGNNNPSDTVYNVQSAIILALMNGAATVSGNGDSWTFIQATTGTAGVSALGDVSNALDASSGIVNKAVTSVASTVGGAAGALTSSAVSPILSQLWPILLVVGLGIVAYLVTVTGIGRRSAA